MREIYQNNIGPWLWNKDSETWHTNARTLLHLAEISPLTLWLVKNIVGNSASLKDKRLSVTASGISFENPLIVGAGWTKDGTAVEALHAIGFGGVEVGTITPLAQDGNQKPRQWMLTPGVALNHLGFNNPGMEKVADNIKRYRGIVPMGVSIGKNKNVPNSKAPEDYAATAQKLSPLADYVAINVSSPNTIGLGNSTIKLI